MEHIDVFLLFPETEDEILELGEETQAYSKIVNDLTELKELLKGLKYRLYYDSDNLKNFIKKAQELSDKKYLDNIGQQIRVTLDKRTTDVHVTPNAISDCQYYKWDANNPILCKNTSIIPSSAEKLFHSLEDSEVVIVSFIKEDSHHRDIMPVIKDARHILPEFCCVRYFNPVNTFAEWLYCQIKNKPFCLQNLTRFERTSYIYEKQRIYQEKGTAHYWYYDYFHKDNKEHYEVFDKQGLHLAEADINGNLDLSKKDNNKSIQGIIH